jgi:hypothetical protein
MTSGRVLAGGSLAGSGLLAGGLLLLAACSSQAPQSAPVAPTNVTQEVGKGTVQIGSTSDPNRSLVSEAAPDCQRISCDGELSSEAITALRSRALLTRRCYEKLLEKEPKLMGRLTVGLRFESSGHPCRAGIVDNALGKHPEFETCVLEVMNQPLDALPSGCVEVHVPLAFVPKEEESAAPDGGAPEMVP